MKTEYLLGWSTNRGKEVIKNIRYLIIVPRK
jgi:hypothetical protein